MKLIKHIAFSAFLTLSIFCAVVYSSCSKNECGGITCLNDGTCSGGICKCVTGTDGVNCQNIYRNNYALTYKGIPPDDPTSDTTNTLIFLPDTEDTTNYNTMRVIWVDTAGLTVVTLPVELINNTPSGSNFTIPENTSNGIKYTGNGNISTSAVSMTVRLEYTSGGAVINRYFNNYIKQ